MGKVRALCISKEKGTQKYPVQEVYAIENFGIENDAHAGAWHRQVSLLSFERFEAFREQGAEIGFGAFGENVVVEGFDLKTLPVGTILQLGEVHLEISQIGKNCHNHCTIYKTMGDCIMPREGIFARVRNSGRITVGDSVQIVSGLEKSRFSAAVITMSDKGFKKEREDTSAPIIVKRLEKEGFKIEETLILPDEKNMLMRELCRLSDQRQIDIIITTGGTGFSKRDVTPEATVAVCERIANGISQAILFHSIDKTDRAMLSRGVAGIRKRSLIINLPGSPKAVLDGMDVICPILDHAVKILRGITGECASQ